MRSLLLAAALFASTACGRTSDRSSTGPASPEIEAKVSVPRQLTIDPARNATCPLQWTCDDIHFFGTQSTCLANCGGQACFRDFNCTLNCVCP